MTGLSMALAAATLALLLPSSSLAASGVANGVRVRTVSGGVVVFFGKHADRAFAKVRGDRQLRVSCTAYDDPRSLTPTERFASSLAPGPGHRRLIRVRLSGEGAWDVCEVGRDGSAPVATVVLTERGRTRIDEQRWALKLASAFEIATDASRDGISLPSTAEVVALSHGTVVALPSADASPPKGTVGYFSDNPRHGVVAALSAAGRRLYFELDDDSISSNVLAYLIDEV